MEFSLGRLIKPLGANSSPSRNAQSHSSRTGRTSGLLQILSHGLKPWPRYRDDLSHGLLRFLRGDPRTDQYGFPSGHSKKGAVFHACSATRDWTCVCFDFRFLQWAVGSGVFLFASVLEKFLGLYVSLNAFSQLIA